VPEIYGCGLDLSIYPIQSNPIHTEPYSTHRWQHEAQRQDYLGLKDGQPHTPGHHKAMVSPSKTPREWKTPGGGKYCWKDVYSPVIVTSHGCGL
jgi:hypothetical protein